jgi:hypothetical protein
MIIALKINIIDAVAFIFNITNIIYIFAIASIGHDSVAFCTAHNTHSALWHAATPPHNL